MESFVLDKHFFNLAKRRNTTDNSIDSEYDLEAFRESQKYKALNKTSRLSIPKRRTRS